MSVDSNKKLKGYAYVFNKFGKNKNPRIFSSQTSKGGIIPPPIDDLYLFEDGMQFLFEDGIEYEFNT